MLEVSVAGVVVIAMPCIHASYSLSHVFHFVRIQLSPVLYIDIYYVTDCTLFSIPGWQPIYLNIF